MSRKEPRLPIKYGQRRTLHPPARRIRAPVDLTQRAEVTFVLRSRGSEDEWRELVAKLTSGPPAGRRYLTRAELGRKWGATPQDVEAVRRFATAHGLEIVSSNLFRRAVVASGSLRKLSRAFSVDFFAVAHPDGVFRSHDRAPEVPQSIHPLLECVLGLDTVPAATANVAGEVKWHGMDRHALLEAYAIPKDLRGKGQCVAVIELGGGYGKRDLFEFFAQLRLLPPRVRRRGVGGVKNDPAPPAMMRQYMLDATPEKAASDPKVNMGQVIWSIETMTDLCMVGTIAPEASILLVQASNDDQGQYHAMAAAILDTSMPSVISISWGAPEPRQTPAFLRGMDRWLQAAAVLGITVCCSTGDSGPAIMTPKGGKKTATAQFPASSPYALACGGTTLDPEQHTEVAWNQTMNGAAMASGGGFSKPFPLPPWQSDAGIKAQDWIPQGMESGTGRAVPDVAARANLAQGYCVIVGGEGLPCGGTSAAAPLWGGVVAILNEGLKARVGSLHESLYNGSLSKGIRDIVAGDTGIFHACEGWDACTGWGSPQAEALLDALRESHKNGAR